MKTVNIYAAQHIHTDEPPNGVTIVIAQPMPDIDGKNARAWHLSEASALADALWQSLPGGTLDALVGVLHMRAASQLRIPMLPTPGGAS